MKHFSMTRRADKPPPDEQPRKRKSDAAFDLWLKRGLHKLYDDAAQEPIPDELLKLIEDDRNK